MCVIDTTWISGLEVFHPTSYVFYSKNRGVIANGSAWTFPLRFSVWCATIYATLAIMRIKGLEPFVAEANRFTVCPIAISGHIRVKTGKVGLEPT